jgi:predicted lipoprotein with Yx(FWY)xxD motif
LPQNVQQTEVLVKRISIGVLVGLTLALAAVPAASARASGATINLRHTRFGSILFNGRGFVLYAFTPDTRNHDACAAIRQCLNLWPPVTARGPIHTGRGVKRRLLGTIRLRGGRHQVTYAGRPLYTYVPDRRGAVNHVNIFQFGGYWPAVDANGNEVPATVSG